MGRHCLDDGPSSTIATAKEQIDRWMLRLKRTAVGVSRTRARTRAVLRWHRKPKGVLLKHLVKHKLAKL